MLEMLKKEFMNPPAEFGPIPFWFWNDELSEKELLRQLHEFHAKEVSGVVIHPRMGLSRETPYLSEAYMALVKSVVAEAAKLGMSIILYDEGMYPSGSACGLVVKQNPAYASRGLRMEEHPCSSQGIDLPLVCSQGEVIVAAQAVHKLSQTEIAQDSIINFNLKQDRLTFIPADDGEWSILLFIETNSQGTIRGVHFGQDDGEADAPLAADLLNPEAVQTFITITHECYYKWLAPHFGKTIFAFFTDEPDLLGRGHLPDLKPWTHGFINEFLAGGNALIDLPALWFEAGQRTHCIRSTFDGTVRKRLARTYYKQLADWCENHGIGLTGHPAASDDIGLLEHFHIPGQDVVWRYIAPEVGNALTGPHSTMGKCSSDAARHRGRRRNLNECFGACGKESGWALSADNMKWYLDWLFVRGVNMIVPHAFYYSIVGERQHERPPDVGPNNIWWPVYNSFARYMKRMSWLMTDSFNLAEIAVLSQADNLPWRIVKPLYENQLEFNYLEEELLPSCRVENGMIRLGNQFYKAILIENSAAFDPKSLDWLERFAEQGGFIVEMSDSKQLVNIGQVLITEENELVITLSLAFKRNKLLQPTCPDIRISQIVKGDVIFYVIVNEGEVPYFGELHTEIFGHAEIWDPWTGETFTGATTIMTNGCRSIAFSIARRGCLIIAIDPSKEAVQRIKPDQQLDHLIEQITISGRWEVQGELMNGELHVLQSWTEFEGMSQYSGRMTYSANFELHENIQDSQVKLDLGDVHELATVWVNGIDAGTRMWKPYTLEIGHMVRKGINTLRIEVVNSLANRHDGLSLPSGLLGPVTIQVLGRQV
ncbi:hypothetical protein GC096_02170 [Paenibacillus sp. LMG 31461]|uniref:Beta-mannosidase-like galactose-binding domain-containing protein n=1 Tax=Paenibacillus plantarum TaxID=2654975 RepID=A0ABX1X371_9BACL|nr:glycosylhydrolase-like jelly roll fold domain-containing protein [Paenibacillus plantarum]NOU62853.1 hypothetical protein [Paenibacillus plantarum]